jgi:hypothetical protein
MNRNKYRNLFLALHGKNERLFSREIQKAIKKDLADVNYNLDLLVLLETQKTMQNEIIKIGKQIGSINYNRLTKDQKRNNPFFSQVWQNYVIENSKDLIGTKITTIKETLINDVRRIVESSNNIFDISKEISTFVNKPDFYKWQSLRIARTETTIAMNTAVNVAGEASGVRFVKRWISAGDGNERESHAIMNGTTTTQQGQFGNGLSYPGDTNGEASEIINCRCTFLQEPIRE